MPLVIEDCVIIKLASHEPTSSHIFTGSHYLSTGQCINEIYGGITY